jgi:CheY-like chemotaxis protein
MRKLRVLGPFLLTSAVALACGDKLMLVMRLRLAQLRLGHPLAILAFAERDLPSSDSIRQLQLQPAVKRSGHRFQFVEDAARLDQALKADKYDLVFADVSLADELSQRVQSVPYRPLVVPVAYKGTKAQDSATQKKFHCLLRTPSGADQYFEAVDQALQWKAKGAAR